MIPTISHPVDSSVDAPASPRAGGWGAGLRFWNWQHAWIALLAAMVLAGPQFLPSGSTIAPLSAHGPMSASDSVFFENGASENMSAKTVAAVRATAGTRPLLAVARAGDRESSYIANLVQSVAWPRSVAIRYVDGALPTDWPTQFDAMILCHCGAAPAGARVVTSNLVFVDPGKGAP